MKLPTLWETIGTDGDLISKRLRVLGGWIVHIRNTTVNTVNTIFVADPEHLWELGNTDD